MVPTRFKSLTLLAVLASGLAHAQSLPDAGSLNPTPTPPTRDERPRTLPEPAAPDVRAPLPPLPSLVGISVEVRHFAFAGNRLFSAAELTPLLQPYLNRPLDFAGLQAAAAAVADHYRQAGWVVRTYLPAQDLGDGVVTIQVLETVLDKIRVEQGQASRLPRQQVLRLLESRLQPGQPLNLEPLDRALLLTNELPGVRAEASLAEGGTPGSTDVVFTLSERPAHRVHLSADNAGAVSTGEYRLIATGESGNLAGLADRLSWNGVHSEGSDLVKLGYDLPLGGDGWRAGLRASTFDYRLTTLELAPLHAAGSSSVRAVDLSYPLIRSRAQSLNLALSYEDKTFENRANSAATTRYKLSSLTVAVSGCNCGAATANRAETSGSLQLVGGYLDLDGSPNQAADASGPRTAGSYTKLRYSLSYQQDLAHNVVGYLGWNGQIAGKNLDSSERLYLVGPDGVRAFPSGEAGGSEGQVLSLELRWHLHPGWVLTPFYDYGEILVNRHNDFAGRSALNRYALQGGGLSLAWQAAAGSRVQLTWGRRSQPNPNPTATGADQDGTHVWDRLWFSADLAF